MIITKLSADGKTPVYTTHFGGTDGDIGSGIALDTTGNIYVTGVTLSTDFPVTRNVQSPAPVPVDKAAKCFVSKLNAAGNALVYSTLLGASKADLCTSIAVDSTGSAIVAGATTSRDFPTRNAAQANSRMGSSVTSIADAFVMKLSPAGSVLYSTYLGGAGDEVGFGIAVDAQGNAFVAGNTLSITFPTRNPYQAARADLGGEPRLPSGDAFVAKLNPQGSDLVYSTYLGGSLDDRATAIAIDAQGNAFITGNTLSTNFPVTSDASQKILGGQREDGKLPLTLRTGDAFFAHLGPSGSLVYATYAGGTGADYGTGIAVDRQGGVILVGGTNSTDFPVTPGAA